MISSGFEPQSSANSAVHLLSNDRVEAEIRIRPGTATYNMALGLRRAEETRDYLVMRGVNADRIEIASNGSGGLIAGGTGERADSANRRAEFQLFVAGTTAGRE